jgi:hypothetical protein
LESDFWKRLDEIVSDEQRARLHAISTARGDANGDDSWPYRPKAFPSVIGWHERRFPVRVELWTKGTWFYWRVSAGKYTTSGDGQKLPVELQHFWALGNRQFGEQMVQELSGEVETAKASGTESNSVPPVDVTPETPTAKPIGKQLGTVLGKPIYEGDLNKNTSTQDNLKRLILGPLTEDYCRKHGLGRTDELNAKVKDEKSRKMVSMFVLQWELQQHLYEKHGGRVEVSAFGNVAFDGMRKWLDEREQAGDFEITDPQLKTVLSELYNQVPPGTMFAKPEQLKTAFDPASTDRLIEIYAKIPAGAHRDPAYKLVGVVFGRPIYLHDRHLNNKVELPALLYTLVVPELEASYRKQHPEVEPTDAEIDDLTARRKAGFIQAAVEQRKSLEAVLTQNRQTNPKSPDDPRTLAAIKEVDDRLKDIQTNDGRSHAAEFARRLKFQEHIFENFGGGRGLSGGSSTLVLVDAQKRWLEERQRLGEFQIVDAELRQRLDAYWTIAHHPGARLIEDAAVRDIFDYSLRGKAPSNSRPAGPSPPATP